MIRTWRYTLWVMAGLALLIALFLMSRPADAQQLCAPAPDLLKNLQVNHGEFIIMRGKAGGSEFIVLRAANGSWSVVMVTGDVGCLMAGGKASEMDKGV